MATFAQGHLHKNSVAKPPKGWVPEDRRRLEIASIVAFPLVLGFFPLLLQRWLSAAVVSALYGSVAMTQCALVFILQTRSPATFLQPSAAATLEISDHALVARRLSVEGAICFACSISTLLVLQLFGSSFELTVQMLGQAKELSATAQGYNILCTMFYGMTVFMVWSPAIALFARSAKRNTLQQPSYWFFFGISAASLACMRLVNYGKQSFSGLPIQNALGPNPLPGVPAHWAVALAVAASVSGFIILTLAQALFMWTIARFTRFKCVGYRR